MPIVIGDKKCEVTVEIGVMYNTYLRYELDMMSPEIKKEEAQQANKKQKELFSGLLLKNIDVVEKNIVKAALIKREEMMASQTEESYGRQH